MALPALQQRLLAMYLALPIPQQEDFLASCSTKEQGKLAEDLAKYEERENIKVFAGSLAQGSTASDISLQEKDGRMLELQIKKYREKFESEGMISSSELVHHFNPRKLSLPEGVAKTKPSISIGDIFDLSHRIVRAISKCHQSLSTLVFHHEALLRSRWRGKTRAQKKDVLLAAWPDMAPSHRPDMAAYIRRSEDLGANRVEGVAWPYINLEDLLLPNTLLIFLITRARYFPAEFAYFDLEMAPMFKLSDNNDDARGGKFSMEFLGTSNFQEYARWIGWDKIDEREESIRTGRTVTVYHGFQILLIQQRILLFLVQCASILIGELRPHSAPAVSQEIPDLSSNARGITLRHIVAREAPYRLPTRLDLARLVSIISAQKREAIEHAWALREDPSYFADALEQVKNHRGGLIPDADGAIRKDIKKLGLSPEELGYMVIHAYRMIFNWDYVSNKLKVLQDMSVEYADAINLNENLPTDFFNEFVQTRYFLERVSVDLVSYLRTYLYASPGLRYYMCREDLARTNNNTYNVFPRKRQYGTPCDRIGHLLQLSSILDNQAKRNHMTLHVVMDEFERFMQSDTQAKALMSPLIAVLISQLAIVAECLHHLHGFQPWARHVENEIEAHRSTKFTKQYDVLCRPWSKLHSTDEHSFVGKLSELAATRDGRFHYPAHERRTQSTVKKMRSAEAALDKFWDAADAFWLRQSGYTPGGLIKDIVGTRELYRTQIWTQPSKAPRKTISLTENADPVLPFSGHVHDRSKEVTGTFTKQPAAIKIKQKTHGYVETKTELEADTPNEILSTAYTVDKRAFKVFRNLFHSPDSPDQPGQIIWTDFLHAMISVGFGAEKLQGSAWHFTPSILAAERSIQFHEPHPSNKLPIAWAKRYGRRLNRAFGWTGSSFKLA